MRSYRAAAGSPAGTGRGFLLLSWYPSQVCTPERGQALEKVLAVELSPSSAFQDPFPVLWILEDVTLKPFTGSFQKEQEIFLLHPIPLVPTELCLGHTLGALGWPEQE